MGDYLVWLGRITKKKGIIEAIRVAKRFHMKLLIAAKIDVVDRDFYLHDVKPLLTRGKAEYVGELGNREKKQLLKNAYALVNPITWNEPFGLVMVESQACGTPVVAFNRGAAAELIAHGKTGFVVKNETDMLSALKKIPAIKRMNCRLRVEKKFAVKHMVDGYEAVYNKILAKNI
jgi:glycosyltransferase involved in cell wall biosynthesis